MPASYSIGKHFEQFVQERVRSGEYASASEVVRDALRLLEARKQHHEAKLAALRAEVQRGLDGPVVPADEAFAAARARLASVAKKPPARG